MLDVMRGARGTRWKDCSAAVAARTKSGGVALLLLLLVWRIKKLYLAGDVMWDGENSNSDINVFKMVEHQTCDNNNKKRIPSEHHHSSDPKFRAGKISVGGALSRAMNLARPLDHARFTLEPCANSHDEFPGGNIFSASTNRSGARRSWEADKGFQ
jgi:hypothetical protein